MRAVGGVVGIASALVFFWWTTHDLTFPLLNPPSEVQLWGMATVANILLLGAFCCAHSIMVGLDRWLYLTMNAIFIGLLFCLWTPTNIWLYGSPNWWWQTLLFMFWLGGHLWIVSHMGIGEFFGFFDPPSDHLPSFRTEGPYAIVRHPMHTWILFCLLLPPWMSLDRLVYLIVVVIYLSVAIPLEEERLRMQFKTKHEEYCKRVPMLIPFLR